MQDVSLIDGTPDPQPELQLNKWQKRQAMLLYRFASMEHLKRLKELVDDFMNGDSYGIWCYFELREFQEGLAKQVVEAASENYHVTGHYQCLRRLGEIGGCSSAPEQEEHFEAGMSAIEEYASPLDATMRRAWSDDMFDTVWRQYAERFPRWPRFRVCTDVEAESGQLPIRTGVYVPQNDPYGTLQFAWTGNNFGCPKDCSTFNVLGLQAIAAVGREGLWAHDHRLLRVVRQPRYLTAFKAQRNVAYTTQMDHLNDPGAAAAFISGAGIETRPCKWYYVEPVEGEFEDPEPDAAPSVPCVPLDSAAEQVLLGELVATGQICPQTGWWQSADEGDVPDGRRHLDAGEPMPYALARGKPTLWQRLRHERPLQRRETIWEFVAWDDCAADTETGNIEASPGD